MTIVQDPGDTTAQDTGRLCIIHNAENSSDKSAQQSLELWKAAVSLDNNSAKTGVYLKYHYWTNSILHGVSKKSFLINKKMNSNFKADIYRRTTILKARKNCTNVLKEQILTLQPLIIIASGKFAADSLYDIGLIKLKWDNFKYSFSKGAYKEGIKNWNKINHTITVFCTYHTSRGVVNRTVSKKYVKTETEKYLKIKRDKLNKPNSVDIFLKTHDNEINVTDCGMRYLLNHWLDIGFEIRSRYKEYTKAI